MLKLYDLNKGPEPRFFGRLVFKGLDVVSSIEA
jgi:hypothetical protein